MLNSKLVLRFLLSAISWKPLSKEKLCDFAFWLLSALRIQSKIFFLATLSNFSTKLCPCITQLHETAPSFCNNLASNLTEMYLSKRYQTAQSQRPKFEWIEKYFHDDFRLPLISQWSVVELTLIYFLDPCNSFWELINQHVHIESRLQLCVHTATLRFAQSVISWKPLHEFKAQFLLWCFN